MKTPYVFTERSLADIIHHTSYYDALKPGLGDRFFKEVGAAAEQISSLPKGFPIKYKNIRERKLKNFPHALLYPLEEGVIYIHAVFALKQNPGKKFKNL
jgi:hypothetical protein